MKAIPSPTANNRITIHQGTRMIWYCLLNKFCFKIKHLKSSSCRTKIFSINRVWPQGYVNPSLVINEFVYTRHAWSGLRFGSGLGLGLRSGWSWSWGQGWSWGWGRGWLGYFFIIKAFYPDPSCSCISKTILLLNKLIFWEMSYMWKRVNEALLTSFPVVKLNAA